MSRRMRLAWVFPPFYLAPLYALLKFIVVAFDLITTMSQCLCDVCAFEILGPGGVARWVSFYSSILFFVVAS